MKKDEGRIFTAEEVAAANATDTVLQAENEVVRTFKDLTDAENNTHEKGLAFGRAMITFRAAHKGDWMARLKEMRISYWKAKYWINEVEGIPNNRHRKYEDDRAFCVAPNAESEATGSDKGTSDKGKKERQATLTIAFSGQPFADGTEILECVIPFTADEKKSFQESLNLVGQDRAKQLFVEAVMRDAEALRASGESTKPPASDRVTWVDGPEVPATIIGQLEQAAGQGATA